MVQSRKWNSSRQHSGTVTVSKIYVNDLPNVTQNTDTRIYLYADDAKIYRSITCGRFTMFAKSSRQS